MPKYVNPNTYPINLSISQPVAVNLVISPHSWPASRLAFNAQQEIELPEAVGRNFTAIGMLALAPEDDTRLAVSPPRPPDDKKTALTTRLPDNPDFDRNGDPEEKDQRPLTTSNKISPPPIPKGKGTYVVGELPDKRILFLSGPVLEEVGLLRFAEHQINFPNSGYTRLSLVYGDNEDEASRSRRYGHFLQKVIREHPVAEKQTAAVPAGVQTAAELYDNLTDLGEAVNSDEPVAEDNPKKKRSRKPRAVKMVKPEDLGVTVTVSSSSSSGKVEVVGVEESADGETFRPVIRVEKDPEVSPKVIPKFAPPVAATPKPKALFSFKPKPKVTP